MELAIDKTKLRDEKNRYKTQSLFFETNQTTTVPIFTLKEQDHEYGGNTYISMKRLYLEMEDVAEYDFAIAVLGSWIHWERLYKNATLRPHIDSWREELEIKIRSKAIKSLVETATTEGSKGTAAAKWIASGQWKATKGRPSKESIEKERKIAAGIDAEIDEDAKRLGIH